MRNILQAHTFTSKLFLFTTACHLQVEDCLHNFFPKYYYGHTFAFTGTEVKALLLSKIKPSQRRHNINMKMPHYSINQLTPGESPKL